MHDIWNPWHGCRKYSEGCQHCYMFYLDQVRNLDGSEIFRTKAGFRYPLAKDKNGSYKVKSGELIRVCMTSDFFLEEADNWRPEVWDIIRQRSDVKFFILTKRAFRIRECLPPDWCDGWENVILNVTCENQVRADERVPILLDIPAKHKGIMCAPFIGSVSLKKYLSSGEIEQVICGGENYDGLRPCHYEWVKQLHDECMEFDVTFAFIETGSVFVKDGRIYRLKDKRVQAQQAYRSGLGYQGKPVAFKLVNSWGLPVPAEDLYVPWYGPNCFECGSRLICNGCARCGRCGLKFD